MREHAFVLLDQERRFINDKSQAISRELGSSLRELGEALERPMEQFRAIIDLHHADPASFPRNIQKEMVNGLAERFVEIMKDRYYADQMYFPVWQTLARCMRDQMLREWKAAGK